MAFEKTTLKVFKRRLEAGEYANATGARRAVGKTQEMSDAEKKKAYAAIDAHPGPWNKKPEKVAKKPAGAVKKTTPAKKAAKKVAKKSAAKTAPEPATAPTEKPQKASKAGRAKRTPRAPRGGTKASEETRPSAPAASPSIPPGEPPPVGDHRLSADDVVRNPLLLKNTAGDLVGTLGRAYEVAESVFKNDPSFDLGSFGQQTGEGLKKAVALANATAGGLHDAAVRAGAIPGVVMTPSTTPPAPEPAAPGSPQDVLNRSADAAEKVHGTGKYTGPGRTS